MKLIGILTQDFRIYYDVIKILKTRNIPFISLTGETPIPTDVEVVITSMDEAPGIDFPKIVKVGDDIELAVNQAHRMLFGKDEYKKLIIGIDPGERPGMAVIGDGEVITTDQISSPESITKHIRTILRSYPAREVTVRIGHGDTLHRNRIINSISGMKLDVEIADESSTTVEGSDIQAAINIAFTRGYKAKERYEIEPTEGELREIQRRSRMLSKGKVTIPKRLAEKVASGDLTLEDAVKLSEKG